MKNVYFVPY